jgi:PEP-CTERM motif
MRRVMRTSFTIAMATALIGLAVSQARADRVGYSVDRCFGAGCVSGNVRVGELSLAFTESSLGVIDSAASASALANFSSELGGVSGINFAGSAVTSQSSGAASTAQHVTATNANPTSMLLPASGMSLSFGSEQASPAFATSIDLGRSLTSSSSSFSVSGVPLTANAIARPYWSNESDKGGDDGGKDGIDGTGVPGGAPVPEPTTMLLLGTGLAGAAAIVRKRLKTNRR